MLQTSYSSAHLLFQCQLPVSITEKTTAYLQRFKAVLQHLCGVRSSIFELKLEK